MVKAKAKAKANKAAALPSWAVTPDEELGAKSGQSDLLLSSADGPSRKRRQLARRDTEDQCERAVEQHFSHMTKAQLESITVDGLCVRARIMQDIKGNKDCAARKRLGATYWKGVVAKYNEKLGATGQLEVKNKTQPVRDSLLQAIESATRKNPATRTIEPLVALLQHCASLNQREFVGMFTAVNSCSQLLGRLATDTIYIEAMKYVRRAKQVGEFAQEIEILKPHFDISLSHQWGRMKKAGVGVLTWLGTHRELVTLLLDEADVDAVMSAKGSWTSVGPQVARLTSAGHLGKALFGFAGQLVNSSAFGDEVAALVKDFVAKPVSMDTLAVVRQNCESLVERYKGFGVLAEKRKVIVRFMSADMEVMVHAPSVEWEYKLNAALKQLAVGAPGGVQALFYEEWFMDTASKVACALPEDILKPMQAARVCARDIMAEAKLLSFADLRKLMLANASTLMSLDRSFKLELEFLEGPAEGVLGASLDAKALACLPTATIAMSLLDSVSQLNDLLKTKFCNMMPTKHQARVDAVLELVSNMMRGISPDSKIGGDSAFFRSVLERLATFMRLESASGSGTAPAQSLVGQPALAAKLRLMKARVETAGDSVKLLDLEAFQAFKWLMTPEEQQSLGEWVRSALQRASSEAQAIGSCASEPSRTHTSAGKSKATAKDTKQKDTMSFFG